MPPKRKPSILKDEGNNKRQRTSNDSNNAHTLEEAKLVLDELGKEQINKTDDDKKSSTSELSATTTAVTSVTTETTSDSCRVVDLPNMTEDEKASMEHVRVFIDTVNRHIVNKVPIQLNSYEAVLYHWFSKGCLGDHANESLEEYLSYWPDKELSECDQTECGRIMDRAMLSVVKKHFKLTC